MIAELSPSLVTALGAVAVAVITTLATLYATRKKAKGDVTTTIIEGFAKLNAASEGRMKEQDERIEKQAALIERCERRVDQLEEFIRQAGLKVPGPDYE